MVHERKGAVSAPGQVCSRADSSVQIQWPLLTLSQPWSAPGPGKTDSLESKYMATDSRVLLAPTHLSSHTTSLHWRCPSALPAKSCSGPKHWSRYTWEKLADLSVSPFSPESCLSAHPRSELVRQLWTQRESIIHHP